MVTHVDEEVTARMSCVSFAAAFQRVNWPRSKSAIRYALVRKVRPSNGKSLLLGGERGLIRSSRVLSFMTVIP